MPRKPKLPEYELVIQSLSTGKIIRDDAEYDDFTGDPIPLLEQYGPWKPPADLMAKREDKRRSEQADQRRLLQVLGIAADRPKAEYKPFKRRI